MKHIQGLLFRLLLAAAGFQLACNGGPLSDEDRAVIDPTFSHRDDGTECNAWGEPCGYDDGTSTDQGDGADGVEKVSSVDLMGWAVRSSLVPCDGTRCLRGDNEYVPNVISYSSLTDFGQQVEGRCGRNDGTHTCGPNKDQSCDPGYALHACILPWAPRGQHRWTWRFNESTCKPVTPAQAFTNAQRIEDARVGFRNAVNQINLQIGSGFTLQETTGPANIEIQCTDTAGVSLLEGGKSGGAIAAGYPTGTIHFDHPEAKQWAANNISPISQEQCDDAVGAQAGPLTGAFFTFLPDEFWWYDHAKIDLNWVDFWGYIQNSGACAAFVPSDGLSTRIFTTVALHEFSHILGFQHQSDTQDVRNFMNGGARSCDMLQRDHGGLRPRMQEALVDLDIPSLDRKSLTRYAAGLACYSPL